MTAKIVIDGSEDTTQYQLVAVRGDKTEVVCQFPVEGSLDDVEVHVTDRGSNGRTATICLNTSKVEVSDNIRKYLRDRGMLDKTIDKWELGYSKQQRRISIPIRNEGGELVAISGRAYGSHQPKYLHSKFHRNVVLYGEHLIEPGKECYLVEGFFQALAIDQAGYPNALARMGTHLSKWQKQKIDRCFNKLVIVPDGDDAGMESAHKIYQEMKDTMPCQIVDMPPGKDADSLELGQLHEVLKGKKNFLDSPRVVP